MLVVEDEATSRLILERWLSDAGYRTIGVASAEDALKHLGRRSPDVACLDLGLPGMGGLELLGVLRERHPSTAVIILTGERDVDMVVTTVRRGALDYLVKPLDRERVLKSVRYAADRGPISAPSPSSRKRPILGSSAAMRRFLEMLEKLAPTNVSVLVHGESGTGKELAARALHELGPRPEGPFVALNCAAIPESLQESEFFGHERGAFTGATSQRKGAMELADKGTLFLDEVGELGLALQAKLLRALQERSFRRVGGEQDWPSDFRLVTATHRDLAADVEAGRFRSDLFFRLTVFELELPPLRERHGDLEILANAFIAASSRGEARLTPEALRALEGYHWPGNVRELENAIMRALVVCRDGVITPDDLPQRVRSGSQQTPPVSAVAAVASATAPSSARPLEELERQALETALEKTRGNVTEAVRILGIGRTTAYRLIKKYGMRVRATGSSDPHG
ncbi:MAG: sigma-54 dependent transcriptional regulator [Polyangiaceae bacterium]